MLNPFIGQYKNERTLIMFAMMGYTTICMILSDIYYMNALSVNPISSMNRWKRR